ncbi:hypothetical protein [Xenorhabdus sp. SGI240]|uniref:hypothetical protein n=1 Tax=Xenorhabdus sp. SGI240 TaxID=3158262 RepID=UPI0032B81A06
MNENEIFSKKLNKKQQAVLWRQRLFEAEPGLNKYLIELKGGVFFDEWIQIKKEIYESVPTSF